MSRSTSKGDATSQSRSSTLPSRMPIPDQMELERRFAKVLASMDLPPDKAKLLNRYDDEKKWEMICDQEKVSAKQPPDFYLNKLRIFLDPSLKSSKATSFERSSKESSSFRRLSKISSSLRVKKELGDSSSTQTLKDLEISLRTNNIQWVRDFLSEQHNGLDVLVSYLSYAQLIMRTEQLNTVADGDSSFNATLVGNRNSYPASASTKHTMKMKSSHSKLNFGDAMDDVHVGILCLRAIMNHQGGFNQVFAHKQAINCIALSLNHKSPRTKALVLELLAAVCLVSGGHQVILNAFDNFKEQCHEGQRFETLMKYFCNYEEFHIDFMVACMQFINIAVHSVEDMNYRVHLQHEFTLLELDDYLSHKLRHTESERLQIQVNAYLDNMIDVRLLLEDSDTKSAALDKMADMELELSYTHERIQEVENEAMERIAHLEQQLANSKNDVEQYKELYEQKQYEVASLSQTLKVKHDESTNRLSSLEEKLRQLQTSPNSFDLIGQEIPPGGPPPPAPPPPQMAPPPPPPPPPGHMGPPPPPPPPGMGIVPNMQAMLPIKKTPQSKCRLPVLNWCPMKPNQVKGTVFAEMDDEKLYSVMDLNRFEEIFRLGRVAVGDDDADGGTPRMERRFSRRPETVSLLEPNRLRNVAITRRKIELTNEQIIRAIHSLDLKTMLLEVVEILLRIVPNDQEIKAFREYEADRKPIEILSDEDKFMISLMKVERLSQKLHIMSYIGNFFDTYQHLQPQLNAVIAAAMSIKNSRKVKRVLEIVLAIGNYMNSAKRGPVYGFKLQSLDMLMDTKSSDRRLSILHYIAQTVQEKFTDLITFDSELQYLEKASVVSLENIATDITELEKGMELTKREYEARKDRDPPAILREFHTNAEEKMRKLKTDCKTAQEAFASVVSYYGESAKTMPPSTFFSLFVRFVKAYRQAFLDLETWKKQEDNQQSNQWNSFRGKQISKQPEEAVVNELRRKQRQIKEKKVLNREEVYHGALEDILLDLKNEPYLRADGVRRSQRNRGPELAVVSKPSGRY